MFKFAGKLLLAIGVKMTGIVTNSVFETYALKTDVALTGIIICAALF